jgi:glycosyltransferase involved in cell wall biosynthesis
VKILLNRRPVEGPWGGGNHFVRSFYDVGMRQGHEIVSNFCPDLDAILMVDPRYDDLGISINEIVQYKAYKPSTFILHRINECDSRKGTNDVDGLLRECSRQSGASIFVSNWMKNYHISRGWHCVKNDVVYNGVDRSVFKPNQKINNGKINIVAHHWSDNYLKGFDVYDFLDNLVKEHDHLTFTYIGRDRGTFQNTNVIAPMFGKSLGDELGRYDVYVSGSRYDPGPNHILESLACEIPTYVHKDGGGAVEFAGDDHVYHSLNELKEMILERSFALNKFQLSGWDDCVNKYITLLENTITNK